MSKYAGYALALFVGITLTVGFYEGRRLVNNTQKAWAAAQSQVTGKDANTNSRRKALIQALEDEKGPEHVAQLKEHRQAKNARPPTGTATKVRPMTPGQNQGVRSVQKSRKSAYKDLTPEQKADIRDRRKARRDRIRVEHAGADPNEQEAVDGVRAKRPPVEDVEFVDEPLEDTADVP